jgi:hypothetical protein
MKYLSYLFVLSALILSACDEEKDCSEPSYFLRHDGDTVYTGRWEWKYTVVQCIVNVPPVVPYAYSFDTIRQDDRPIWMVDGHPILQFDLSLNTYIDSDGRAFCLTRWATDSESSLGISIFDNSVNESGVTVSRYLIRMDLSMPMDTIVVSPPFKEYPDSKCHTMDIYTRVDS